MTRSKKQQLPVPVPGQLELPYPTGQDDIARDQAGRVRRALEALCPCGDEHR